MPLGQQGSITEQLVIVHDLDVCHPHHACPEEQKIIIVRRAFEFAADIDDHQIMTGILDLTIGQPTLAEQLCSPDLEIRQSSWRDVASPCGPSRRSAPGWSFRNFRSCQTGSGLKFEHGGPVAWLTWSRGAGSRARPMRGLRAPLLAGLQGTAEADRKATFPGWGFSERRLDGPSCETVPADDRGLGTAANSRTHRETPP